MKFRGLSLLASRSLALMGLFACTAGSIVDEGGVPARSDDAGSGGAPRAGSGGGSAPAAGTGGGGSVGAAGAAGGGEAGATGRADAAAPDARTTGSDASSVRVDAAPANAGEDPPAGWVPAIIGAGYAGVRVRSTDVGQKWGNEVRLAATGGDDENLLRSIAYGQGVWGTGGWQYFTSRDGKTWTKSTHPCGGGIVDGLAYGLGRFVAACADTTFVSTDGFTWKRGGKFEPGGHPKVVFGGGKFAAYGDAHKVFSSTDGVTWTPWPELPDAAACDDTIKSKAACGFAARGQGVWLKGWAPELGGEGIFRSADGKNWTKVYPTGVEAFAFGYAPP